MRRDVVGVMLTNQRGEVLLQLRDDKPGLRYPNMWTLFGGAVEEGENPADAILRELHEELEIAPPVTHWKSMVCSARTVPGEVVTMLHLYHAPLDAMPVVLHEGQAMAWFTRESAAAVTLAFEQSGVLDEYFAVKLNERNVESP
jgi:8-oxo-dGTP diphosphatase